MDTSGKMFRHGVLRALDYVGKDPDKNLPKLMKWVDRFAGNGENSMESQRAVFRKLINDPNDSMHKLVWSIWEDIDGNVVKTMFENFLLNAVLTGWQKEQQLRASLNCNVPWAILMDPTSACNLHCTGCWAAEYGNKLNLTFEEMDSVIKQGKDLGIYFYIFTGGEPLVRKDDLIQLCLIHDDCIFMTFTNGTLIDEYFADQLLELGNFMPVISVEGFEEATDSRRGSGTYKKAVRAMRLLKEKRLPFGVSCCYTRRNIDSISSDDFFDQMVEWGAKFAWYFHYMPVGNDAVPELMPTPEQREYMYHKIREARATKPIFAMDFQNDGEYVDGCVAGGRRYFHINANGDADPCVFIHYSDSNIKEKTLLEILQSPLFMAYHDGQPFNDNHLRPCPLLENPEKLREIISKTGAKSTDPESPESADHLCDKCVCYAKNWKPTADKLWSDSRRMKVKSSVGDP